MFKLKEIPEMSRDKLIAYCNKQSNGLEASVNELLHAELKLRSSKPAMTSNADIPEIVGAPGMIGQFIINGVENGTAFFLADITAVHALTGIMVLTPEEDIVKNIEAGEISPEDEDNFKELMGAVVEGINSSLATVSSKECILELKESMKSEFNEDDDSLKKLPKDDYLIVTFTTSPDNLPEVTFHFLLPRITGEIIFDTSLEPEVDWGDRKIVVVYDTVQSDREIIRDILESENIGVADFNSLKSFLMGILREEVDVIIMEARPNDWDSIMVTRKIRKSAKLMNIPVIMTVESPTNEIIFMAYKAGVRNFLVKPLDKSTILEKVLNLCA